MLTTAELTSMRAATASAMPSLALVARRPSTKNAMGGRDVTAATVTGMTAVPCHVHPDTQSVQGESEQRGRLAGDARYRIVFAWGTDVRATDIVTVDTVVYEISAVDSGRSWALEVEAVATRSV